MSNGRTSCGRRADKVQHTLHRHSITCISCLLIMRGELEEERSELMVKSNDIHAETISVERQIRQCVEHKRGY